MTAGVPSEEQLRRIRERVLRRIDARRRIARQVAGGAAAFVLLGGGIGLLASGTIGFGASGGSTGGGAGGSRAEGASATVVVRCHDGADLDSPVRLAKTDSARLPASAVEACVPAVDFQSTDGTVGPASPTPRGLAADLATGAVCRDADGTLQVFLTSEPPKEVCAANDLTLVDR